MSDGSFEYKCRRCGVTESGVLESGDAGHRLIEAVVGLRRRDGSDIQLLNVHVCGDGGAGVADLIGFRKIAP